MGLLSVFITKLPLCQRMSTPGGKRRGWCQASYLPLRCLPDPHPGHPGHLFQESPFFLPFLRALGLPGVRVGPGGQAGCRQVEGSPFGSPCGQRLQAAGLPHKGGHRPRGPKGSWRSPVGGRRAVSRQVHWADWWAGEMQPEEEEAAGRNSIIFLLLTPTSHTSSWTVLSYLEDIFG